MKCMFKSPWTPVHTNPNCEGVIIQTHMEKPGTPMRGWEPMTGQKDPHVNSEDITPSGKNANVISNYY